MKGLAVALVKDERSLPPSSMGLDVHTFVISLYKTTNSLRAAAFRSSPRSSDLISVVKITDDQLNNLAEGLPLKPLFSWSLQYRIYR
jgi:hypothetical protein